MLKKQGMMLIPKSSEVNLWQSNQSDSAYNGDDHSGQDQDISDPLIKKNQIKSRLYPQFNMLMPALGSLIRTHS